MTRRFRLPILFLNKNEKKIPTRAADRPFLRFSGRMEQSDLNENAAK